MFMSIQPGGLFLKENTFTKLKVVTESKTYDIQLDDRYPPQKTTARFLLVGSPAAKIWHQITALKKVTVEFDLSTGKHYSIDVNGQFMDRIARMFAACAS